MKPITQILVPTDFSAGSEAAFRSAAGLASRLGASITLLHVVDVRLPELAADAFTPMPELVARAEDQARVSLDAARHLVGTCAVRTAVRSGVAWREILAEAKREGTDLIVMGTRGRGGLVRALLGSTADSVVRKSVVPVMTVHTEPAPAKRAPSRQKATTRASRANANTKRAQSHVEK